MSTAVTLSGNGEEDGREDDDEHPPDVHDRPLEAGEQRAQALLPLIRQLALAQLALGGAQQPAGDPDGNQKSHDRQRQLRERSPEPDPGVCGDRPDHIRRVPRHIDTGARR